MSGEPTHPRRALVAVVGDSASGKSRMVANLRSAFGADALAHLSGDAYHRAERHDPLWQRLTHLNPEANDLERLERDVASLSEGRDVDVRPYSHRTGRFEATQCIEARPIVVVSGLHALHTARLRALFDLAIYLAPHEGLRKWRKIRRDTKDRGHAIDIVRETMQRRAEDARRFIHPQRRYADIILSLQPREGTADASVGPTPDWSSLPLALELRMRDHVALETLTKALNLAGVTIDTAPQEGLFAAAGVRQPPDRAVIAQVADELGRHGPWPKREEAWAAGYDGVSQLAALATLARPSPDDVR